MEHKVFLSLGSSQGNRVAFLKNALACIEMFCGKINRVSKVYETEPWGFEMKGSFLNIAVEIQTGLSHDDMIQTILHIEKLMHRTREKTNVYMSRTIDIDIIFYDDIVMKSDKLTIPHPHIHERRFVLQPLSDIAPDLVHPELNATVAEMLSECRDKCLVNVSDISL